MKQELKWLTSAGRGRIYTFAVSHRPPWPGWHGKVPYILAIVHLEEDFYMFSEIVDCDPDEVSVGMSVEVTFERVGETVVLPKFRPLR